MKVKAGETIEFPEVKLYKSNFRLKENSPLIESLREQLSIARIEAKETYKKYEAMKKERDDLHEIILNVGEALGIER